mmetsp:Transcript_20606/g.44894  ORF Transcript_20606/g.44894 Transcript_20606/m.44894 type:complete len:929 (-) Transcript_20606:1631-4417(-)
MRLHVDRSGRVDAVVRHRVVPRGKNALAAALVDWRSVKYMPAAWGSRDEDFYSAMDEDGMSSVGKVESAEEQSQLDALVDAIVQQSRAKVDFQLTAQLRRGFAALKAWTQRKSKRALQYSLADLFSRRHALVRGFSVLLTRVGNRKMLRLSRRFAVRHYFLRWSREYLFRKWSRWSQAKSIEWYRHNLVFRCLHVWYDNATRVSRFKAFRYKIMSRVSEYHLKRRFYAWVSYTRRRKYTNWAKSSGSLHWGHYSLRKALSRLRYFTVRRAFQHTLEDKADDIYHTKVMMRSFRFWQYRCRQERLDRARMSLAHTHVRHRRLKIALSTIRWHAASSFRCRFQLSKALGFWAENNLYNYFRLWRLGCTFSKRSKLAIKSVAIRSQRLAFRTLLANSESSKHTREVLARKGNRRRILKLTLLQWAVYVGTKQRGRGQNLARFAVGANNRCLSRCFYGWSDVIRQQVLFATRSTQVLVFRLAQNFQFLASELGWQQYRKQALLKSQAIATRRQLSLGLDSLRRYATRRRRFTRILFIMRNRKLFRYFSAWVHGICAQIQARKRVLEAQHFWQAGQKTRVLRRLSQFSTQRCFFRQVIEMASRGRLQRLFARWRMGVHQLFMDRHAQECVVRFKKRCALRSLSLWADRQCIIRGSFRDATRAHLNRLLRRAICTLKQHATKQKHKRRADAFHESKACQLALRMLHQHVGDHGSVRRSLKRAEFVASRHSKRNCLFSLKQLACARRRSRAACFVASEFYRRSALSRSVRLLYEYREEKKRLHGLLAESLKRWSKNTIYSVYKRWREFTKGRLRRRRFESHAKVCLEQRQKSRAVGELRAHVYRKKQNKLARGVAVKKRLRRGLAVWKLSHKVTRCWEKIDKIRKHGVVEQWKVYVWRRRMARRRMREFLHVVSQGTLLYHFGRWRKAFFFRAAG